MIFKFVGSEAEINNQRLSRFGQSLEMPEDRADEAICGGCLPAKDYDALFTIADEQSYPTPGHAATSPAEFTQRRQKAWAKLGEYRDLVDTGKYPAKPKAKTEIKEVEKVA